MLASADPAVSPRLTCEAQASLLGQQRALDLPVEALESSGSSRYRPGLAPVAGALRFAGTVRSSRHASSRRLDRRRRRPMACGSCVSAKCKRCARLGLDRPRRDVSARSRRASLRAARARLIFVRWGWSTSVPTPLPAHSVFPSAAGWSSSSRPHRRLAMSSAHVRRISPRPEARSGRPAEAGHGYLVHRGDGRIVIGSHHGRVGFVKPLTTAGLLDLLTLASRWCGPRPSAPATVTHLGRPPAPARRRLPLIGPLTTRQSTASPSVWVCSGHYRNGILLAPASVGALTAQICRQSPASPPRPPSLAAFSPGRYSTRGWLVVLPAMQRVYCAAAAYGQARLRCGRSPPGCGKTSRTSATGFFPETSTRCRSQGRAVRDAPRRVADQVTVDLDLGTARLGVDVESPRASRYLKGRWPGRR